MRITNSFSFLVFGLIMRLLPVFAPTVVASDATSVAAAEATTRGLWLVTMGYVFAAIGAWFFFKDVARRAALGMAQLRERVRIAEAREARVRALMHRLEVRVQY